MTDHTDGNGLPGENDVPPYVNSWASKHARENPGHRAREGLNDPGTCDDCRERSPIYDLTATPIPPGKGDDA